LYPKYTKLISRGVFLCVFVYDNTGLWRVKMSCHMIPALKLTAFFKPLYHLLNLGVNDLRLEVLTALLLYWTVWPWKFRHYNPPQHLIQWHNSTSHKAWILGRNTFTCKKKISQLWFPNKHLYTISLFHISRFLYGSSNYQFYMQINVLYKGEQQ
jgi:hypothetical protein